MIYILFIIIGILIVLNIALGAGFYFLGEFGDVLFTILAIAFIAWGLVGIIYQVPTP